MKVALVASQRQYMEHLEPIFRRIPDESFMTMDYRGLDLPIIQESKVWVSASKADFRDYVITQPDDRLKVYMEHGTGLQGHRYDTVEMMERADLILLPNEFTKLELKSKGLMNPAAVVVGTPKMDDLISIPQPEDKTTIALSFHWTGSGQNWRHYEKPIIQLRKNYKLIGHAHPYVWSKLRNVWRRLGIEPVATFEEVVRRAWIYACDHSSTLYEWAALDRPLIKLERRNGQNLLQSSGLLYDDYQDIGITAGPKDLEECFKACLNEPFAWQFQRKDATDALYPHLGSSSKRAIHYIREAYERKMS